MKKYKIKRFFKWKVMRWIRYILGPKLPIDEQERDELYGDK